MNLEEGRGEVDAAWSGKGQQRGVSKGKMKKTYMDRGAVTRASMWPEEARRG